MVPLTIILVADLSDKCDMYIFDDDSSNNYIQLIPSIMEKAISKAKSSPYEISLRSIFSDLLDSVHRCSLRYRSLIKNIMLGLFMDDDDKVDQIILCDFSTYDQNACNIQFYPTLYKATCGYCVDINKSILNVVSDITEDEDNVIKVFTTELYSVERSDGTIVINPSIGNLERFQKIAEAESLRTKETIHVKKYSADGCVDTVYSADCISDNSVRVHEKQEHSDIDREAFCSNRFELRIDDKDYLSRACAKVDFQGFESSCKLLASFYFTNDTRELLDSCLYRAGTKHKIALTLYNHDSSIVHHSETAMMEIKKNHFSCDVNSDGTSLLIEILFESCIK